MKHQAKMGGNLWHKDGWMMEISKFGPENFLEFRGKSTKSHEDSSGGKGA